MSVCKFLAADIPLQEVKPSKDYPMHIDIDNGIIDDGGADDNFFLLSFPNVRDYANKKYGVSLEWNYTDGRAEQILEYIKENLEKTEEVELWKKESDGKTALLIEGARRIGKSTVTETFAKEAYKSYILIDFSKASKEVCELFDDISDLDYVFLRLQLIYKTDLYERESLIIFDEVQLCPKARQAIKHLVKDHRYDYIETGTLISIHKNIKDILIPSEERKISMYPMDFEEFLWAKGDLTTSRLLAGALEKRISLGDAVHRKLMRDFRLYMLVGGMPQAVETYIETNNFRKVDEIKRDILKLYEDDFRKIDASGRISMLFDAIPAQLNTNASRYQVSSVLSGERADTILKLVADMADSGTVQIAYHANDPNVGLANAKDLKKDSELMMIPVYMLPFLK